MVTLYLLSLNIEYLCILSYSHAYFINYNKVKTNVLILLQDWISYTKICINKLYARYDADSFYVCIGHAQLTYLQWALPIIVY